MMDAIKEWVISIATIMVFVVILQMIMPSGSIRKVINLALGLIVIIVVIQPLYKNRKDRISIEDFYFKSSLALEKKEILADSRELEKQQINQIIEVYRSKLKERIKLCVSAIEGVDYKEVSLIINENADSEEFGNILSVNIFGAIKSEDDGVKKINIEKVEIQTDNDSEKTNSDDKKEKQIDALEIKIKKKVSNFLEISEDVITVSIGGD